MLCAHSDVTRVGVYRKKARVVSSTHAWELPGVGAWGKTDERGRIVRSCACTWDCSVGCLSEKRPKKGALRDLVLAWKLHSQVFFEKNGRKTSRKTAGKNAGNPPKRGRAACFAHAWKLHGRGFSEKIRGESRKGLDKPGFSR